MGHNRARDNVKRRKRRRVKQERLHATRLVERLLPALGNRLAEEFWSRFWDETGITWRPLEAASEGQLG